VGVTVLTSVATVGKAAGVKAVDFGDQVGMAKAIAADINTRGGVLGRKLVPVIFDQDFSKPDATSAQEACTRFTQDRPTFAVASMLPAFNNDTFYSCLAKRDTPMVNHSQAVITNEDLRRYAPYLSYVDDISYERLVPALIGRLSALGYFGGWDAGAGAPGKMPVKVGLLYQDSPSAKRGYGLLRAALERRGVPVASEMTYSGMQDQQAIQSAVLSFRSRGVTHVFMDSWASLLFPTSAEQQQYRPRYGLTTQNVIATYMEANAPERQLHGALGIGWEPASDVSQAHDPGNLAGTAACTEVMRRANVDISSRQARWFALLLCDLMNLAAQSAVAGHGFSTGALTNGLAIRSPGFNFAAIFGGARDGNRPDRMGLTRDIGYDTSCQCFHYLSKQNYPI
jgi:hypothetical protein